MFRTLMTTLETTNGVNFNPDALLDMLPYLGEGMLSIFIEIGIIILITTLLNKLASKK